MLSHTSTLFGVAGLPFLSAFNNTTCLLDLTKTSLCFEWFLLGCVRVDSEGFPFICDRNLRPSREVVVAQNECEHEYLLMDESH